MYGFAFSYIASATFFKLLFSWLVWYVPWLIRTRDASGFRLDPAFSPRMGTAAWTLNLPAKSHISTSLVWFGRDLAGAAIKGTFRADGGQGGWEALPPVPRDLGCWVCGHLVSVEGMNYRKMLHAGMCFLCCYTCEHPDLKGEKKRKKIPNPVHMKR